jgi:quercetin dioxygenase-like cupin family protein
MYLRHLALGACFFIFGLFVAAGPARAQTDRQSVVIEELIQTTLPQLIDQPYHFRLDRVILPAGDAVHYAPPEGIIMVIAGTVEIATGPDVYLLKTGQGSYIPADEPSTFAASGKEDAIYLHFLLFPAGDLLESLWGGNGRALELFRSMEPIPGILPGPYEFTLTRMTLSADGPPARPFLHSGGALYFVLGGAGEYMIEGMVEEVPVGGIVFEPFGFAGHWVNLQDQLLVIVVARIYQRDHIDIGKAIRGGGSGEKNEREDRGGPR